MIVNRWNVPSWTTGVYRIWYRPSGASYVGSSGRCIGRRVAWHLCMLRASKHPSCLFQEEWDNSTECDWDREVLEICSPELVIERERVWTSQYDTLLGSNPAGLEWRSAETRRKISEGRARYLETPGAREALAEKARQQHADGNFGRSTWR